MRLHRILLVEDDPDIRMIAEFALRDLGGMLVTICETGHEALAYAPQSTPDLIVLDWMLPDTDGIDTFLALRGLACCAATPIVFLTAKTARDDLARLQAIGAAAVLLKPFDPLRLARQLQLIWESCCCT
jgi:CheY-like chemotaxis protein